MPGKTKIGGTAYDVKPGSVMVGGTVYTIKEGKTMIDGTAYSIKFSSDVVVTITGDGKYDTGFGDVVYAYVEINGTQYTSAATITVPAGTEIYCKATYNASYVNSGVFLNGTRLRRGEYTFGAESDVSIELKAFTGYGRALITTT